VPRHPRTLLSRVQYSTVPHPAAGSTRAVQYSTVLYCTVAAPVCLQDEVLSVADKWGELVQFNCTVLYSTVQCLCFCLWFAAPVQDEVLSVADKWGELVQYNCTGFMVNRRQQRMARLAAMQVMEAVRETWEVMSAGRGLTSSSGGTGW